METTPAWVDWAGIGQLVFRFIFNLFFVWLIIHVFYYRKSKNRNFYFTFSLISISVFFLIYLLGSGSIKMKMGMALGLFAIFGIIRYRTEMVSVREMTYLFVIIAISVINALSIKLSYAELFIANVIFVAAIWAFEGWRKIRNIGCKHILYDRIDNIKPDRYPELLAEVKERTGLRIINIEVGAINYLQDSVMLKVFYELPEGEINTVDKMMKLPNRDNL